MHIYYHKINKENVISVISYMLLSVCIFTTRVCLETLGATTDMQHQAQRYSQTIFFNAADLSIWLDPSVYGKSFQHSQKHRI